MGIKTWQYLYTLTNQECRIVKIFLIRRYRVWFKGRAGPQLPGPPLIWHFQSFSRRAHRNIIITLVVVIAYFKRSRAGEAYQFCLGPTERWNSWNLGSVDFVGINTPTICVKTEIPDCLSAFRIEGKSVSVRLTRHFGNIHLFFREYARGCTTAWSTLNLAATNVRLMGWLEVLRCAGFGYGNLQSISLSEGDVIHVFTNQSM